MSRPGKPRTIGAEAELAERIASAREQFGWTVEELARRMTEQGCPIHGSAVWKMERGKRRIHVDDAAAFEVVIGDHLAALMQKWGQAGEPVP